VCAKGVGKGILVHLHKGGDVTPGGSPSSKDSKEASQIVMCILRATDKIQLPKVAKLMHAESATLCTESEVNVRSLHSVERFQLKTVLLCSFALPGLMTGRSCMLTRLQ
jgi:hypothetical protein